MAGAAVFAAAMAICLVVLFQLTSCASHGHNKRYPKFDKSRIPSKLLVMSDRNMTGLRFYPTDQVEDGLNVSYASNRNVFPLPGCPCVPRLEQCDFECCYCDLGCPLPRSTTDGEGWLEEIYGEECFRIRERKLTEKKALLSLEERRQISSKASDYLCQRADYPLNARMAFYQFFCLQFDNSLSSFHYDVRPKGPNLIRLSDHSSQRFWPSSQTSFRENQCDVAEMIAGEVSKWADQLAQSNPSSSSYDHQDDDDDGVPDEASLLQIRANQMFLLQPPPPQLRPRNNGQRCLRNRIDGVDMLKAAISSSARPQHSQKKMDAHQLLEDVIAGLWRRKMMSSWAPLEFIANKTVESCQHFRSLVASATRPWISRLLEMAQGNKSNPFSSIPIKVLEAKNLDMKKRFGLESQKEAFPEYCLRVIESLEIVAYYDQRSLIQLTYQVETGDGPIGDFRSLDVRIKPVFVQQATKSRLSRFWTEFYNHHCPDQFCWRDVLENFSQLQGNTFSILLAFISAPSFLLLLFPQISYDVI